MAELLKGKAVADDLDAKTVLLVKKLEEQGITPTLAILRVGNKDDDISYERGAARKCDKVGVSVKNIVLSEDVDYDEFYKTLDQLNNDPEVHGILMLRPLPKRLDNEKARNSIVHHKDVDGCTDGSLASIMTGKTYGFAPCTAEAVMETLKFYQIDVTGKNVTILGRSLVVGKPLALLMMNANATVTVCHTKTVDVQSKSRSADIVCTCTGHIESVNGAYFSKGQTVIDVGIGFNEVKQKLCGDVLFDEAEPIVDKITPVPGGIGSVTTSVLVRHVVRAALQSVKE